MMLSKLTLHCISSPICKMLYALSLCDWQDVFLASVWMSCLLCGCFLKQQKLHLKWSELTGRIMSCLPVTWIFLLFLFRILCFWVVWSRDSTTSEMNWQMLKKKKKKNLTGQRVFWWMWRIMAAEGIKCLMCACFGCTDIYTVHVA